MTAETSRFLLAADGGQAIGWHDGFEVRECGGESAGHLRRLRTSESDLVERKVHVGVPVHHRNDETDVARLVMPHPVREDPHRELTQTVMQTVDGLHRGRGVGEGRLGERAFSHVDEHPHAVRDVLFERSLQAEPDRTDDTVDGKAIDVAGDPKQRCTRGNERSQRRDHLENAVRVARQ